MARIFTGKSVKQHSPFAGNGLSRTAMIFKIATMGGVKLTIPELNKIKDVNPRRLEHVYEEVVRMGDEGSARFALSLILKSKTKIMTEQDKQNRL